MTSSADYNFCPKCDSRLEYSEYFMSIQCSKCGYLPSSKELMKPTELKALGKYIIIKVDFPENKTKGGIIIAEKYHVPEQLEGTVLSVGKDVKEDIEVGNRVLINAFVGRNNFKKGKDDSIRIVPVEEIHGIIE